MNNEEKFKKSVRYLLDERQFSYDASNWEKASRELDQKEKRKKRFLFFLFCGLGLCLSGLLIFMANGADVPAKNPGKELTATTNQLGKQSNKQVEGKQNEDRTSMKNYNNTTVYSSKNNINKGQQFNQGEKNKPGDIKKGNQIVSKSNDSVYSVSKPLIGQAVITGRKNKKSNAEKVKDKNDKNETDENILPDKNDGLKQVEEKTDNNDLHGVTINNSDPKENAKTQETEIKPPSTLQIDEVKKENEILNLQSLKKDTIISKLVENQVKDTITTSVQQPTLQNVQKTSYFYVEAGTYVNLGWKYQNVREATSFNPYAGVSYFTKLSDKLGFSIGAYYTSLSNLKTDTKIIKSSKIVFGEESDVTAITPITINYFLMPAKLQYKIDSKQCLTIGYNLGYLFDVRSKVETYTERVGLQENKTSSKLYGYTEGFKSFNSQLAFGYRRLLYKNLWLNSEIIYGLTDLRDNTFFGINFHERMTGLKISLTYDLLKK